MGSVSALGNVSALGERQRLGKRQRLGERQPGERQELPKFDKYLSFRHCPAIRPTVVHCALLVLVFSSFFAGTFKF
jgi:hypothetical protein